MRDQPHAPQNLGSTWGREWAYLSYQQSLNVSFKHQRYSSAGVQAARYLELRMGPARRGLRGKIGIFQLPLPDVVRAIQNVLRKHDNSAQGRYSGPMDTSGIFCPGFGVIDPSEGTAGRRQG